MLVDVERAHILRVLQATAWRIEGSRGAAVALGLKPSTLRSRMRKLGVNRSPAEADMCQSACVA
jgi:transcriptional regulator with GAF, ATPase, and Fis domain